MDSLFRSSTPVVPVRGVHLDLKGAPPTPRRLRELLRVFAAARYNAVLVEWEDSFPWTVDVRFRSERAYTPEDVRAFVEEAGRLGIELIPLVQCLGHMETPLSVPGYEALREVPHRADVLNPLADGARELVERMVEDVLALMPGVRRFHLGGDEAWSFGTHPDTKAFVERHGKGALYLHHVEPILAKLSTRSIRPILWHDMMRDWEPAALDRLRGQADLCVWGYHARPGGDDPHHGRAVIERFAEHGVPMWGGAAYKGADGHNVDLPDLQRRQENALGWAEVSQRYGMLGVFATAWSRYSTHTVQNEPIDAALDSLVNVGAILHDGAAPEGGIEACRAALAAIGERERFDACRDAMRRLTDARARGWRLVAELREFLALVAADPRRHGSDHDAYRWGMLRDAVGQADQAGRAMRTAFEGLIDRLWIDRYLAERVEPLREELLTLEARVRQVNPAGFAARFPDR